VTLRVLLADDQLVTLEGVRLVLEAAEGISVVGEAHTATELYSMVARARPDLVLIDPALPGLRGFESFQTIRGQHADVKVVVFGVSTNLDEVESMLQHGATAYIVKTIHPLDLAAALRQTAERTVFHGHSRDPNGAAKERPAGLTERELEMLTAVARGLSNKAISQELWVTEQTVKFHLTNVYRKLGVANRTAAVRYAHEHGLVSAGRSSPVRIVA
jgi:DNA-binding NarL/FixJ family response regulator